MNHARNAERLWQDAGEQPMNEQMLADLAIESEASTLGALE